MSKNNFLGTVNLTIDAMKHKTPFQNRSNFSKPTSKYLLLFDFSILNLRLFPVMRKKFFDFIDGVHRYSGEYIFQPQIRINALHFAGTNHTIDHGHALCCFMASGEQVIFPAQSHWTQTIFDRVVVDGQHSVRGITHQLIPSFYAISHRYTNGTFWQYLSFGIFLRHPFTEDPSRKIKRKDCLKPKVSEGTCSLDFALRSVMNYKKIHAYCYLSR